MRKSMKKRLIGLMTAFFSCLACFAFGACKKDENSTEGGGDKSDPAPKPASQMVVEYEKSEALVNGYENAMDFSMMTIGGNIGKVEMNSDPQYVKEGEHSAKIFVQNYPYSSWSGPSVSNYLKQIGKNIDFTNFNKTVTVHFDIYNADEKPQTVGVQLLCSAKTQETKWFTLPASAWTSIDYEIDRLAIPAVSRSRAISGIKYLFERPRGESRVFYVDNLKLLRVKSDPIEIEKTVKMVDLAGQKSFDVTSVLKSSTLEVLNRFENVSYKLVAVGDDEEISLKGGTIDFSVAEKKNYYVYADFATNGEQFQVQVAEVDFYDESDPFEWAVQSSGSAGIKAFSDTATYRTETMVTENAPDRNGKYSMILSTQGSQAYNMLLIPKHSKAYYERYRGLNFEISMEVYLSASDCNGKQVLGAFSSTTGYMDGVNVVGKTNPNGRRQITTNRWHTISFRLDDLLVGDLWERVNEKLGMFQLEATFYTGSLSSDFVSPEESVLYVGNVSTKQLISEFGGEILCIDLDGATSYCVQRLLTDEQKELLAQYESNGEVVWKARKNGGEKETELVDGTLEITDCGGAYYNLVAYKNDLAVIVVKADFYNSGESIEWTAVDEAYAYTFGVGTIRTTDADIPEGKTGKFILIERTEDKWISIALSAKHSKKYYSERNVKDGVLGFDVYIKTANNVETGIAATSNGSWEGRTGWNQYVVLNRWSHFEIPLSWLLENYDSFNKPDGKWLFNIPNVDWTQETKMGLTSIYIGNFSVQGAYEGIRGENMLLDTDGKEYIAAKDLIDETNRDDIQNLQSCKYVLKINESETIADENGRFAVRDLKKGINSFEVRNGKICCYSRSVDIYALSDGMVFTSLSEETAYVNGGACLILENAEGVPGGKDGAFLKITRNKFEKINFSFKPLHSKEYYELFGDDEYAVTFDLYIKATGNVTGVIMTTEHMSLLDANGNGKYNSGWMQVRLNSWVSAKVTLTEILMNYEKFEEKIYAVIPPCDSENGELQSVEIFVGNIHAKKTRSGQTDLSGDFTPYY